MLDTSCLPYFDQADSLTAIPLQHIASYAAIFAAALVAEFDAQEYSLSGRPIRNIEAMVTVRVQTADGEALLRVPSDVSDAETTLLEARVHVQEAVVYAAIGEYDDALVSAAAAQWHSTGAVRMAAPASNRFAALHDAAAARCRAELTRAQRLSVYDLSQVLKFDDARHAKFAALCLRLKKVCELSETVSTHPETEGFQAELITQSCTFATLARSEHSLFARLEMIKTSLHASVLEIVQRYES